MITCGFYPAPIDYSIFVTDWRNALVAILLLVSGVIIGHMADAWSLRPVLRQTMLTSPWKCNRSCNPVGGRLF